MPQEQELIRITVCAGKLIKQPNGRILLTATPWARDLNHSGQEPAFIFARRHVFSNDWLKTTV